MKRARIGATLAEIVRVGLCRRLDHDQAAASLQPAAARGLTAVRRDVKDFGSRDVAVVNPWS